MRARRILMWSSPLWTVAILSCATSTCWPQGSGTPGAGRVGERYAALRSLLGDRAVSDAEARAHALAALRQELDSPCDTPGVPAYGTGLSASESLICAYAEALGTVTTPEELDRLRNETPGGEPLAKWLLTAEARARALAAYESCADGDPPRAVGARETVRELVELLKDPYDLLRARAACALGDLQALEAAGALKGVLLDAAFRDVSRLVDVSYGPPGEPVRMFPVRVEARLALARMGYQLDWVSGDVWDVGPYSELRGRYDGLSMALRSLRVRRSWTDERKIAFCLGILRRELETPSPDASDPEARGVPEAHTSLGEDLQSTIVFALGSTSSPVTLAGYLPGRVESRHDKVLLCGLALCAAHNATAAGLASRRPWVAEQLMGLLRHDPSDWVRSRAAYCLGELGAPGPPEPEVQEALVEALRDDAFRWSSRPVGDPERVYMVRQDAAHALRRLRVRVKLVGRAEGRYELDEDVPAGAPANGGAMFGGP